MPLIVHLSHSNWIKSLDLQCIDEIINVEKNYTLFILMFFFELLISFWVRYCSFFEMTTKPPFFWTRGNIRDCFSYWIWFKPMAIKESDTCTAQIGCRAGEFMRYANASFNLIVLSMHICISMWIVFAAKWLLVAIFIAISLSSFPCYFNARKSNCTVNTYTWLIILN